MMYLQSTLVVQFASRLGLSRYTDAVGLIVLLSELDAEHILDSLNEDMLFAAIGGNPYGLSGESLLDAYAEYCAGIRRTRERDRKRRQNRSVSGEKTETAREKQLEKMRKNSGKNCGKSDGTDGGTHDGTAFVTYDGTCSGNLIGTYGGKTSGTLNGKNGGKTDGNSGGKMSGNSDGTNPPAPSPLAPSPPLSPFSPAPPIPPIIPRNPIPRNPNPRQKKIDVDDNWRRSSRARGATAQRIVDEISLHKYPCNEIRDLYDVVHHALDAGIPPDDILASAAEAQDYAVFVATMMTAGT